MCIHDEYIEFKTIYEAAIPSPERKAFSLKTNHSTTMDALKEGILNKEQKVIIAYLPSSALIFNSGLEPYSASAACTAAEFISAAEEFILRMSSVKSQMIIDAPAEGASMTAFLQVGEGWRNICAALLVNV